MGKPLDDRLKTAAAVQTVIDDYFAQCKDDELPPVFEGLAYALGVTLQTLRNYEHERGNRKDSHCTEPIQRAMQYITANYETMLAVNGRHTGALFALKNRGWTDTAVVKQELSITDLRGAFDLVQASVITPTLVHDADKVGKTGT